MSIPNSEKKYIVFKGNTISLTKNKDGFWADEYGTLYAYADLSKAVDDKPVCGVGIFTLGEGNPLNAACAVHDFMYSSDVYQAFNSRKEADKFLYQLLKLIPGEENSLTPILFYYITRELGIHFWENKETNI